jgi:hypothetical protein
MSRLRVAGSGGGFCGGLFSEERYSFFFIERVFVFLRRSTEIPA